MPRAFNEMERIRIRERLIAAGKKAINRSGARLLGIDDVSREAGISKGSFYSFFPSREDFILSVFEAWEDEHRSALIRAITEAGGSTREKLERFFLGSFEIVEREPGLARMGFGEIERLIEGLPAERIAAHQANDETVLKETFDSWAKQGRIDPLALAALPGIISALLAIALHKDDFREGGYAAAVKLISESLAWRLSGEGEGEST